MSIVTTRKAAFDLRSIMLGLFAAVEAVEQKELAMQQILMLLLGNKKGHTYKLKKTAAAIS